MRTIETLLLTLLIGMADAQIPNSKAQVVRINAEDRKSYHVEGASQVYEHPRSVGKSVLSLSQGSRVTVSQDGRAVYLCLPATFPTPGARYDSGTGSKLRCRVDDRPAQDVWFATARQIIPLSENLPPGRHVVEVVAAERYSVIDAFVFSSQPLSVVQGVVTTDGYSELLMEVRAELFAGDKLIRSEYVRNPVNGTFDLLDVAPGTYRLRFTANGFGSHESAPFTIAHAGEKIDLGVIVLPFDRDLIRHGSYTHPSISAKCQRTFNVTPGGSFDTEIELPGPLESARLVSRFKTIDLKVEDRHQTPMFHTYSPLHTLTIEVPPATPYDMYTLETRFKGAWGGQTNRWPQTVCVREPLPGSFAIAGISHMNTWGQQTSEYLARVAELVQLAGARVLLIANEVNAAYIAGALKELRIPYAITAGNHTMARWDDFFPQRCQAFDDGPMRIVRFSNEITASWSEARDLLTARKDATARILLCYEAFPPLDLIRDGKVNLLFDGHSSENHPQRGQFPPRTLHLRAYESVRWISMVHDGLAPSLLSPEDVPSIQVPREGNLPLRVEFSAANNGTASALTARIINETGIRFPCARVRMVLRAGSYLVSGTKVLQEFRSDDGKVTVIDVETDAPSGSTSEITVGGRKE